MPLELAACRIPKEWIDKLDAMARETGQTRSDVLKAAIAQFIGESIPSKPEQELTPLTERLDRIENLLSDLLETRSTQALTPVNTAKSVERQIDLDQSASDEHRNISKARQKPIADDSQRGNPRECPKCGSDNTLFRRDENQELRIYCYNCNESSAQT
ncbi:ribbon-helix-helix protein, CopG family [Cyanobacteria bacterium FACHB-63]|nr:ribbon-helix-helix protein, CopG family [Cyanobacteria bacterium FACHB-63]